MDIANSANIERRGRVELLFHTGSSLYMQLCGGPLLVISKVNQKSTTVLELKPYLSVTFRDVILVVLVVIVAVIVITIRKKLGRYQGQRSRIREIDNITRYRPMRRASRCSGSVQGDTWLLAQGRYYFRCQPKFLFFPFYPFCSVVWIQGYFCL